MLFLKLRWWVEREHGTTRVLSYRNRHKVIAVSPDFGKVKSYIGSSSKFSRFGFERDKREISCKHIPNFLVGDCYVFSGPGEIRALHSQHILCNR